MPRLWRSVGGVAVLGMSLAAAQDPAGVPGQILPVPGTALGVVSGDFDADGDTDLVVSLEGGPTRLVLLRNAGDGWFADAVAIDDAPDGAAALRHVVAADLDGDGDLDLAAAGFPAATWRNGGGGQFAYEPLADGIAGDRIAIGDVDGDAAPDLVLAPEDGAAGLQVLRNDGGGRFERLAGIPAPGAWPVRDLVIADVDHDGVCDVVALARPTGRVHCFRGLGGGAFAAPEDVTLVAPCAALVRGTAADGVTPALLAVSGCGIEPVGLPARPEEAQALPAAVEHSVAVVGSADVDGDTVHDLVGVEGDGRVTVVLLHPDATATTTRPFGDDVRVDLATTVLPQALVVADLDGTGEPDLATIVPGPGGGVRVVTSRTPRIAVVPVEGALLLARGRFEDRSRVGGDRLAVAGRLSEPMTAAVAAGAGVHVEAGAASAPFILDAAPGDPRWSRARDGVATFRSGANGEPRVRLTLDWAERRFDLVVSGTDLSPPAQAEMTVVLTSGAQRARHAAAWSVARPGLWAWGGGRTGVRIDTSRAGPSVRVEAPVDSPVHASNHVSTYTAATETIGGRAFTVLRDRATGRAWRLDPETGAWFLIPNDLVDGGDPMLDAGLVSFLPLEGDLDDAIGDNAVARSGGVAAAPGGATFDGSGWLSLPNVPLNGPHAFSVWVRPDGDAGVMGLVEQRDANAGRRHFHLMLRGGLRPYFGFYMDDLVAPEPVARGRWTHLVFQYTGTRQEIWVDGRRVAERAARAYAGTSGATRLGRNPGWSNVGGSHFAGSMRRVRIYRRSLEPREIEALHRRELPDGTPPRPAAELVFEGPIDGSDRIVITDAGARWENVHWGGPHGHVRLNGVAWAPRESRDLPNSGDTRFLPAGIDLSRARLVSWTGRDHGSIETAPGRLVLRFVDSPNGPAEYRMVVRFD